MEDNVSHMEDHAVKNSARTVNKAILQLFENLYKSSEAERSESCIVLVRHLSKSVPLSENNELSVDFKYCLKRLVRGLGGTQSDLQKSNFTALVAVLHSFPIISLDIFLKVLDIELNGQDASPGEEGGILTGRILALGAVIRSDLFEKCTVEQKLIVTQSLVKVGLRKSNLAKIAFPFLLDLIRNTSDDVFINGVWPALEETVAKAWADQNLNSLLLLMAILSSHPNAVSMKKAQKWLGCRFLSSKAMPYFAEKLLVVNKAIYLDHPFYEEFCNILCAADNRPMLEKFWTEEVSKQISASPRNKELATLHILSLLLEKISDKRTAYLLATLPVLQIISRAVQASHVDRKHFPELHTKACKVQSNLETALLCGNVPDEERLELILKCFANLRSHTGTHLINLLENKLSFAGIKKLAEQYCSIVCGGSLSDEQLLTLKDRIFAVTRLTRLITLQVCGAEVDWKVQQIIFLGEKALFKGQSNIIHSDLATTLKNCFFRALDQKFTSLDVLSRVLLGIVKHFNALLYEQKRLTLREPFDAVTSLAWQKMVKTVLKLEKKGVCAGKKNSVEPIFLFLFLFMGLELYADAPMAQEALEELHECHMRIKKGKSNVLDSSEPAWVEVTVELLLSLLSHDSHMIRTVVCSLFPHLCKHLTLSSFSQILKVLDPAQGEDPLSASYESEDSDDDSETSDIKQNHVNVKKNGESLSSSEEDSSDESDEEDVPGEEEDQLIDKLRMELHTALGDSAPLTDTESVDLDDIDDEEGERMNSALGQAFKTFSQSKSGNRKKKKENAKKEEAIAQFRNKVLDLIELYVSHEPSLAHCLEALSPLLNLYSFCTKNKHCNFQQIKALEKKVKTLLVKLTGLKKFSSVDSVNDAVLAEKIKSLTVKGIKTSSSFLSLSDLVVECCTFAVRCSMFIRSQSQTCFKPSNFSPIVDVYKAMLIEFFTKRDTLIPTSLFKAVFQLNWDGCWALLDTVVENSLNSKLRSFSRRQALVLLSVFFRNNILLSSSNSTKKQELCSIVKKLADYAVTFMSCGATIANLPKTDKHFLAELLHCLSQALSRPELESFDRAPLSSAVSGSKCGVNKELTTALNSLLKRFHGPESSQKCTKKKKLNGKAVCNGNGGKEKHCNLEDDIIISAETDSPLNGLLLMEPDVNPKSENKSKFSKRHSKKQKKSHKSSCSEEVDLASGLECSVNGHNVQNIITENFVVNSLESKSKSELKRKFKNSPLACEGMKRKKKT